VGPVSRHDRGLTWIRNQGKGFPWKGGTRRDSRSSGSVCRPKSYHDLPITARDEELVAQGSIGDDAGVSGAFRGEFGKAVSRQSDSSDFP
jgi:hypothetical protein